jgi:hypothetical protein
MILLYKSKIYAFPRWKWEWTDQVFMNIIHNAYIGTSNFLVNMSVKIYRIITYTYNSAHDRERQMKIFSWICKKVRCSSLFCTHYPLHHGEQLWRLAVGRSQDYLFFLPTIHNPFPHTFIHSTFTVLFSFAIT